MLNLSCRLLRTADNERAKAGDQYFKVLRWNFWRGYQKYIVASMEEV